MTTRTTGLSVDYESQTIQRDMHFAPTQLCNMLQKLRYYWTFYKLL